MVLKIKLDNQTAKIVEKITNDSNIYYFKNSFQLTQNIQRENHTFLFIKFILNFLLFGIISDSTYSVHKIIDLYPFLSLTFEILCEMHDTLIYIYIEST